MLEELKFSLEEMNLQVDIEVRERQLYYKVSQGEVKGDFALLEGDAVGCAVWKSCTLAPGGPAISHRCRRPSTACGGCILRIPSSARAGLWWIMLIPAAGRRLSIC